MPEDTVRLKHLTWTEIDVAVADGTDTVVVAVGSVEQHGPHLPLIVDSLAGDELARRIAKRLGDRSNMVTGIHQLSPRLDAIS